jgi:hypothetical protein
MMAAYKAELDAHSKERDDFGQERGQARRHGQEISRRLSEQGRRPGARRRELERLTASQAATN